MFAKILKYEAIEYGLTTLVGLILGAAVTIGSTFLVFTGQATLFGIGTTIGFLAALGVPLVVFVLNAMRYYKTVYGGRGYFTNTLPTSGGVVVGAKTLWLFVVGALAITVVMLTMVWLVATQTVMNEMQGLGYAERVSQSWELARVAFQHSPGYLWGVWIAVVLLGAIQAALWVTVASALANRFSFARLSEKTAVWLGIISCFAIYQVVTMTATFAIPITMHVTGAGSDMKASFTYGIITAAQTTTETGMHLPLGTFAIIPVLAFGYWFAHNSLSRHLSLR